MVIIVLLEYIRRVFILAFAWPACFLEFIWETEFCLLENIHFRWEYLD